LFRARVVVFEQRSDSHRQHARLARPRAGRNQERRRGVGEDSSALRFFQSAQRGPKGCGCVAHCAHEQKL